VHRGDPLSVGWLVGIDGGGTGSRAVVVDASGSERARVDGPAALVRRSTIDEVAAIVARLVRDAGAAADSPLPAARLVAGLAGSGRAEVRDALARAIEDHGVATEVEVVTDAEVAFHDAFGTGPGIILIAGTGSMAMGRASDGRTARAGGWGERLGDEGSGWAVGLAGVQAVTRAADGRGPATSLEPRLLAALGLDAPGQLVGWVGAAAKAEVAALAPAVVAAADDGDDVAAEIVELASAELRDAVDAVHRALAPWAAPVRVALTGGLVAPGRPLRGRVVAALSALPVDVMEIEVDAARGAARRALAGVPGGR
jgi:N-acetylglucosamine kinase-like BadF-type ATPase